MIKYVFPLLMEGIEERGTHATGVAVPTGPAQYLWKVAESWSKVKDSQPWNELVIPSINGHMTTMIGHTRQSSWDHNKHKDAAAQPFKVGGVVGAHNGFITNWDELQRALKPAKPYETDSEVIFALLDRYKDPSKALKKLDGAFALTWWKDEQLYMCRTGRPLFCAYVPAAKTLFWNSNEKVLKKTLGEIKYFIYQLKEGTLYRFTPSVFDENGTNVERWDQSFNPTKPKQVVVKAGQTHWTTTDGQNYHHIPPAQNVTKAVSLIDMQKQIDFLQHRIVSLESQTRVLYDIIQGTATSAQEEIEFEEELNDLTAEEDTRRYASDIPPVECDFCHTNDSKRGRLLRVGNTLVHETCVLP